MTCRHCDGWSPSEGKNDFPFCSAECLWKHINERIEKLESQLMTSVMLTTSATDLIGVDCRKCHRQETVLANRIDLLNGWSFTSDDGWLCPECGSAVTE